jgi:hypothetical protein
MLWLIAWAKSFLVWVVLISQGSTRWRARLMLLDLHPLFATLPLQALEAEERRLRNRTEVYLRQIRRRGFVMGDRIAVPP